MKKKIRLPNNNLNFTSKTILYIKESGEKKSTKCVSGGKRNRSDSFIYKIVFEVKLRLLFGNLIFFFHLPRTFSQGQI